MASPYKPPTGAQTARDAHTYIPPQVERAMTEQLKKNVSPEMQKYVGAYVQQNAPGGGRQFGATGQVSGHPTTYRPVTHLPRKSHYVQYDGEQTENIQQVPTQEFSPEQAYDFITNPPAQPRNRFSLGSSSLAVRIMLFSGGLLVLLVGFVVIKNVLSGSSSLPGIVTVAQDQQAILHVLDGAGQQNDLSSSSQNFIATANLTLNSSQSDTIGYLSKNGHKLNKKEIGLKISSSTDAQLQSAQTAGTYDSTFKQVMTAKLNAYVTDLQSAYTQTDGPVGQSLLSDQYDQAKLLLIQLDTKS